MCPGWSPSAGRQYLFGATDDVRALACSPRPGVDTLVARLERLVRQEYERGGIKASTKDAVDRVLDNPTRRGPYEQDPFGPSP